MNDELREQLSDIIHQQWEHWTKGIVNEWKDKLPEALENRWKKKWKLYSELSKEEKDKDRVWADKIITIIKNINESKQK